MNYFGELYKQWVNYQRKALKQLGIKNIENFSDQEVAIYYFEYYFRVLPPVKYEVYISNELLNNPLYNNFKLVIETIKMKAKSGKDLRPYLSKGIKNLKEPDKMLNDWGVYHFHLGDRLLDDGFVNRRRELLFVYRDFKLNPNKLYFLDIYNHGDWSKKRTIEILHNNWPEAIKTYKIEGLIDIQPVLNDEEHKLMRNAGINCAVVLDDGTSYMMLGGGITMAETNQQAVMLDIQYKKFFRDLENDLIENLKIKREQLILEIVKGSAFVYLDKNNYIPLDNLILFME